MSRDPIDALVAQEKEVLAHMAPGGDADSNSYKVGQPAACEGCGGAAHGPVNELVACLVKHLRAWRREATTLKAENEALRGRAHVGVSAEAFEENRRNSIDFESKRGKNKKGGGS
jgi:hypothetical protein